MANKIIKVLGVFSLCVATFILIFFSTKVMFGFMVGFMIALLVEKVIRGKEDV